MKKAIIKLSLTLGIAICSVSLAKAQSSELYRANIPFGFSIGTKQYTAGMYSIEVGGSNHKFFVLRDVRGRNAYAVKTTAVDADWGSAGLDFVRLGDSYALMAIKTRNLISNLPKRKLDDKLAQGSGEKRAVTVALSRGK